MTGSLTIKNGKYYAVINTYQNGKRKQKWIDLMLSEKGNKKKAEKELSALFRLFLFYPCVARSLHDYSHSIVPIGFGVRSIRTLLMPGTSCVILYVMW